MAMNQFPRFIQKAFLNRMQRKTPTFSESNRTTVAYSLADQVARYIPLLELQDRRQLLEVEVVGNCHLQSYQSMILGLDFVRQLLLLDSLTPINPYCPIVLGDALIVSHKQQGQVLSFKGKLMDIIHEGNQLLYAMELPAEIAYQQRRLYPRLTINGDIKNTNALRINLKSPLKTPWHSSINNISAGGLRASIAGKVVSQLSVGQQLPAAELYLHDMKIHSALTVKSFRQERRPYERTEISLAFANITPQDRIRLQNVIGFYLEAKQPNTLAS